MPVDRINNRLFWSQEIVCKYWTFEKCTAIYAIIILIGPCVGSDWSKTHGWSLYKTEKKRVLLFFATLSLYHKLNEEA